jgi:hypothetical protein
MPINDYVSAECIVSAKKYFSFSKRIYCTCKDSHNKRGFILTPTNLPQCLLTIKNLDLNMIIFIS